MIRRLEHAFTRICAAFMTNLTYGFAQYYNQMNYVKYLSFKLYSLFLATSITYISVESVVMLKAAGFLSEKPLLEL